MSIVSLYIPHVFINIDERRIIDVLDSLGLCKVSNVDFVQKIGAKGKYNSVYIHIDHWYNNVVANNFQERVRSPDKEARIVYDDPWYWIALENTAHKFISGQRKQRIDIGSINQNHAYAVNKSRDQINRSYAYEIDYEEANCEISKSQLEESMLDEIEAMMDEEESWHQNNDRHLITIDGRYVKSIEQMTIELKESLHKSRDETMHWFAETGKLQHENNLMADEISCLKAQLSLIEESDNDSCDSRNSRRNWYKYPNEEHEHIGQGIRVGPSTYL